MNGSKNSGSSASKSVEPIARCGAIFCVPDETNVTTYTRTNAGEGSYQNTSRTSYTDKQSGSYGRVTTTDKVSAGNFEWKNGTTGTRSEYKHTSTYRVGDKNGYREVYNEQRVRDVSYDKSGGGKDVITYDKGDGGAYGGGCGHDADSDSDSDSEDGGYGCGHDSDPDSDFDSADGGCGYDSDPNSDPDSGDGGYGYDSDSD